MNMENKQKFWQSPVVWTASAALIYFVVKEWFGFDIPGWDKFITLLVGALLAFGVINNPTSKNSLG